MPRMVAFLFLFVAAGLVPQTVEARQAYTEYEGKVAGAATIYTSGSSCRILGHNRTLRVGWSLVINSGLFRSAVYCEGR